MLFKYLAGTIIYICIFHYFGYKGIFGVCSLSTVSVAGNTIAVPAIIGQMAPDFSPYVKLATIQISCAAILSVILCPFIVQWLQNDLVAQNMKRILV